MFKRDALLLIGHGSKRLPDAARPLMDHAGVIRATGRFGEVTVGMLNGPPDAGEIFDALKSSMVHVVPFFMEDGYFTRMAIPDLLLPRARDARVVRFCPPAGTYDGIAGLLERRLLTHCDVFGVNPRTLSVHLIGHGSTANPGRARALRRHAATLEASRQFGWVRVGFIEEDPLAAETLSAARGHVAAVIGFLANAGVHATEDLPRLIARERQLRGTSWPPVHDLGSIGTDRALPQLIVESVMRRT